MYILEEEKIAINQSLFRYIDPEQNGHPEKLYSRYTGVKDKPTNAQSLGTIIHSAILEGEEFDCYDKPIPPSIKEVYDQYYSIYGSALEDEKLLLIASNLMNSKWKNETKLGKLKEHQGYYDKLKVKGVLITEDQQKTIHSIKELCKQDHIAPYLNESKHKNELKVSYATEWGEYFGTIDRLFTPDETSFRVMDLKTTSTEFKYFESEIIKRKYDRQVGFYTHLYKEITGKEPLNPRILMVQTVNEGNFLLGRVYEIPVKRYYDKYAEEVKRLTDRILDVLVKKDFEQKLELKTIKYE